MIRTYVDAIGAFFSTTLDDLLVLVYLFLEKSVDSSIKYPYARILIGQLIGFSIILLISLIGLLLETGLPIKYIDLIGLIPFTFGILKLYYAIQEDCFSDENSEENDKETTPILEQENKNTEKSKQRKEEEENRKREEEKEQSYRDIESLPDDKEARMVDIDSNSVAGTDEKEESNFLVKLLMPVLKVVLDPLILESTVLSLMCGSDNIVIYTALFASEAVNKDIIIIIIFYVLLLFNGAIALVIVKSPPVVALFDNYSKYVISTLLIALGLDIISSSILWP